VQGYLGSAEKPAGARNHRAGMCPHGLTEGDGILTEGNGTLAEARGIEKRTAADGVDETGGSGLQRGDEAIGNWTVPPG
jgi:hypothetical protein